MNKSRYFASDLSSLTLKIIQNTLPPLGDRTIGGNEGLSGIVEIITGTTITILEVLHDASGVIPVPFIQPIVTIVVGLLKAVQVSLWNLVPVALLTNDC